jgi:hypothetical protein
MYPDENYGGLKKFDFPGECCSFRNDELKKLEDRNRELFKLLDTVTKPNI